MMLAWQLHETVGPDGYRLEEVPDPEPGPGEVLIRLEIGRPQPPRPLGIPRPPRPARFPHVAGADGAGIIEALGPGVATVSRRRRGGDRSLALLWRVPVMSFRELHRLSKVRDIG